MDSDFDRALDDFSRTIPKFDLSSFTSKEIVPPKAQHILESAYLVKLFRTWKLGLTWPQDRIWLLGVWKQHVLIFFF